MSGVRREMVKNTRELKFFRSGCENYSAPRHGANQRSERKHVDSVRFLDVSSSNE